MFRPRNVGRQGKPGGNKGGARRPPQRGGSVVSRVFPERYGGSGQQAARRQRPDPTAQDPYAFTGIVPQKQSKSQQKQHQHQHQRKREKPHGEQQGGGTAQHMAQTKKQQKRQRVAPPKDGKDAQLAALLDAAGASDGEGEGEQESPPSQSPQEPGSATAAAAAAAAAEEAAGGATAEAAEGRTALGAAASSTGSADATAATAAAEWHGGQSAPMMLTTHPGECVECGGASAMRCNQCDDEYCPVCFQALHRKGKRARHTAVKVLPPGPRLPSELAAAAAEGGASVPKPDLVDTDQEYSAAWFTERAKYIPLRLTMPQRKALRLLHAALRVCDFTDKIDTPTVAAAVAAAGEGNGGTAAAAKVLGRRQADMTRNVCGLLSGVVTALKYPDGQEVVRERNFVKFQEKLRAVFEIGRRHKIMNPDAVRAEYGKLVYLLQDANSSTVMDMLQFSCVRGLSTVHSKLEQKGALALLADPNLPTATMEILPEGKSRQQVQMAIKRKEAAVKYLAQKYSHSNQPASYYSFGQSGSKHQQAGKNKPKFTEEEVETCLYSIADNHAYLRYNRDPVDKMIRLLQQFFKPSKVAEQLKERAGKPEEEAALYSLAIREAKVAEGAAGARLTHNHHKQYAYVLQSLRLWRAIAQDMFRLWTLAEQDLLDPATPYTLRDTGQGVHRVQECTRLRQAMRMLLHDQQLRAEAPAAAAAAAAEGSKAAAGGYGGGWVGSSVIHLGDNNVPNALTFIDKYNQVGRILQPIVLCIAQLAGHARGEGLCKDRATREYITRTFGGAERLQRMILGDFFRNGFDGSGADNFFDAGSCIDGRLTSAWNWCSKLEEKPYFPVFLLSGFTGFDGDFK